MKLRRNVVLIVILITAGYTTFRGSLDDLLTPPCEAALVLHPDLPPETAEVMALLHDRGLVYCPQVPSGLAEFSGPLYWASDGVNSLLYYAYPPANPISIGKYELTDRPLLAAGDAGPMGLGPIGRPSYRNQAPEGVPVYLLMGGAPRSGEVQVALNLRGKGEPQTGLSNRNFWTDGENLIRRLRGQPLTTEDGRIDLSFAIVPKRWKGLAAVWSDPTLDPEGSADFREAVLETTEEPALARAVSGPLGAGAWVAGVMSGTRPALVVMPANAPGAPIEPTGFSLWRSGGETLHALFALPALGESVPYRFAIWADAAQRDAGAPPDHVAEAIILATPDPNG